MMMMRMMMVMMMVMMMAVDECYEGTNKATLRVYINDDDNGDDDDDDDAESPHLIDGAVPAVVNLSVI